MSDVDASWREWSRDVRRFLREFDKAFPASRSAPAIEAGTAETGTGSVHEHTDKEPDNE